MIEYMYSMCIHPVQYSIDLIKFNVTNVVWYCSCLVEECIRLKWIKYILHQYSSNDHLSAARRKNISFHLEFNSNELVSCRKCLLTDFRLSNEAFSNSDRRFWYSLTDFFKLNRAVREWTWSTNAYTCSMTNTSTFVFFLTILSSFRFFFSQHFWTTPNFTCANNAKRERQKWKVRNTCKQSCTPYWHTVFLHRRVDTQLTSVNYRQHRNKVNVFCTVAMIPNLLTEQCSTNPIYQHSMLLTMVSIGIHA
jgi:hypothetical protein